MPDKQISMATVRLREKIEDTVQEILRRSETPGAAVSLFADGDLLVAGNVGFRDKERREPLADDARFYIYSITKTMVAVAVLQLVEEGELALDSSVQSYLPSLPITTPILLRQILSHRSGLRDYGALATYQESVRKHPQRPWSTAEFLTYTFQDDLLFAPGEGWHYSNIGYLLLKEVLEKTYGQPLRNILAQQLFAPLGLRLTYVADSLDGVEQLSPGFTTFLDEAAELQDARTHYHPGWVAHGLVVSTAAELGRFMQGLFGGRLLDAPMLAQMRYPHVVPARHWLFRQPAYGLGLMIDPHTRYGMIAGHGGGGPGYSTGALHFSDVGGRQVVSVALANRDQADLGLEIAFALVDQLADESQVTGDG